jgi:hypothetical protein
MRRAQMTLFVPLYKENPPEIRALAGFFLTGMFSDYSERTTFGKGDRPPRIIARKPCGACAQKS